MCIKTYKDCIHRVLELQVSSLFKIRGLKLQVISKLANWEAVRFSNVRNVFHEILVLFCKPEKDNHRH